MKKLIFYYRFALLASVLLTSAFTTRATVDVNIGGIVYEIRYAGEGFDAEPTYAILGDEVNDNYITTLYDIPSHVTGEYVFCDKGIYYTRYLTAPVTTIGKFAFRNSTVLKSVTIPEFITLIYTDESSESLGAFYGCTAITELHWNARYCLTNGLMPTNNIEHVTIGPEVTVLPEGFVGNSKITEVTIPSSVTMIGHGAFAYCAELDSIIIPNSVDSIGTTAFKGCTNLTNLAISNSITTIGDLTFCYCTSLTNITIPNSVTTLGMGSFFGCI